MKVAIVTTTINARPESYREYAKQGDLIIAADINTPKALYDYARQIGAVVLSPDEQERHNPLWSDIVGWQSIQRRNAAVMWAYKRRHRYDAIITVDDDNIPGPDFAAGHVARLNGQGLTGREGRPRSPLGAWVNFGELTTPPTWQRGTPYGPKTQMRIEAWDENVMPNIGVVQSQVLGAPDCDAVTRIAHDPYVTDVQEGVILQPGPSMNFAFNSQATGYRPDLAPLIGVLPFVGRYDDIIASFITNAVLYRLGLQVYVGRPLVHQTRNPHDLARDLRGEIWGMQNTERIVDRIWSAQARPTYDIGTYTPATEKALSLYEDITEGISTILPKSTVEFMRAWAETWKENV